MLLAAILRNYKCYKNINYISFFREKEQNLNVIIGDNGVGKSTILEALDSFFNDNHWIINSESSDKDASVGIVVLIEKNRCNSILEKKEQEIVANISQSFWDVSESDNSTFSKYSSFFSTRQHLVDKKSSHYLLVIGKEYRQKDYGFLSFESKVKDNLENITPKPNHNTIKDIINKVVGIYTYLYIPVETTVSDFLKLETAGMQTLVDKDIKAAISEALNEKRITRTTDKNRKKQISVLEIINEKLEGYIEQIQLEIQQIDSTYDFKPEYRQSSKLTPNHIANVIIEAYYSKRSLKKDKNLFVTCRQEKKEVH